MKGADVRAIFYSRETACCCCCCCCYWLCESIISDDDDLFLAIKYNVPWLNGMCSASEPLPSLLPPTRKKRRIARRIARRAAAAKKMMTARRARMTRITPRLLPAPTVARRPKRASPHPAAMPRTESRRRLRTTCVIGEFYCDSSSVEIPVCSFCKVTQCLHSISHAWSLQWYEG